MKMHHQKGATMNNFEHSNYVDYLHYDFYVMSASSKSNKGLILKNWNNTDIRPNNDNIFMDNFPYPYELENNPRAVFHITNLIKAEYKQVFLDEPENRKMEYLTTDICVLDIDDQRLNPKSPLYDYDFDHSPDRYNLSNKILSIITHENRKSVGRTEVIKSTKGYHIVLRFTEEMLPMLNCKKLKLTDYICNKYGITEDERKRADIDLLLMHQVKKYGYPIKPRMLRNGNYLEYIYLPSSILEKEEKEEKPADFDIFAFKFAPQTKFVRSGGYITYNPIPLAFARYLNSSSSEIIIPRRKQIMIPCVFHGEKEASLSIDLEKNLYHCFGCGAGGNLAQFVMRTRSVNFKEALQILRDAGCLYDEPEEEAEAEAEAEEIDL